MSSTLEPRPTAPKAARWMRFADEFTQGNPELREGIHRLYADESNWPDDQKAAELRARSATPEQRNFFLAALQAKLRHD